MSLQPYSPDPRYPDAQQPPMSEYHDPSLRRRDPDEEATEIRAASPAGAYEESRHERYRTSSGEQVDQREAVYEDPNRRRMALRYWTATVTSFVLGVLEVILLLRFLFRLLAANQSSSFVALLYDLSSSFIAPFRGIFTDPVLTRSAVLEISTLVAMLIYALIATG